MGDNKKKPKPDTYVYILAPNVIECKQWGLQHLGRRGGGRTFGGVLI